jgi:hypothetical protein
LNGSLSMAAFLKLAEPCDRIAESRVRRPRLSLRRRRREIALRR